MTELSEKILLVDAGTGNLHSVYNALLSQGIEVSIISRPKDLGSAGRVILPGVGAFAHFMLGMHEKGLDEAVIDFAQQGKPILGICVGMQALFEVGEEMGDHPGLGLLPGRVVRFPDFKDIKVPHTGWNQINPCRESPLLVDLPEGSYAYFNHSYYCAPKNEKDSAAMTDYGITFTSAVQHGCVYGVQFHPEKSQLVGRQILANFCKRPV